MKKEELMEVFDRYCRSQNEVSDDTEIFLEDFMEFMDYSCYGDFEGYTFKKVYEFGGEGLGSRYEFVIQVTKDSETCYCSFVGSYDSNWGVSWYDNEFEFVEPVEVTKIEYHRVK